MTAGEVSTESELGGKDTVVTLEADARFLRIILVLLVLATVLTGIVTGLATVRAGQAEGASPQVSAPLSL